MWLLVLQAFRPGPAAAGVGRRSGAGQDTGQMSSSEAFWLVTLEGEKHEQAEDSQSSSFGALERYLILTLYPFVES